MAEIGVIASVIGVAGAGFRLSLILNAVGAEVANAGVEIHTISKGVTLFSLMLKQVGQHLQSPQSVHSSEAIETAQTITHECQLVFDEISEMLDKVQTRKRDGTPSPTIQQRFKWCFKKHRVTYLLAQLESLKMSLLVMLQILQLGKLMVTPPHSEAKQDVAQKEDTIQQERAETQNIVIVRFWAISRLDRLYHAAEQEDIADRKTELEAYNQTVLEGTQPQLAIEAPPSPTSSALIRLPTVSLGELDQTLNRIKDSPRDMIQVSESVIDPLLQRWTRCYDILGHTNGRATNGPKFTPSVHDLYESDEEASWNCSRQPDSPEGVNGRGFYLEGSTTNWREPHSEAARREASQLRKQYSRYQPSVDTAPDDYESVPPKKKTTKHHIIDSDLSSSSSSETDSEYEKQPKHRQMPPNYPMTTEQRRERDRQNKNFRKGATRGLLGAGAIAGFLEALEGISI